MKTAARRRWGVPGLGRGPSIVAVLLILGLFGAMAIEPTRQLIQQRSRVEEMASNLHEMRSLNRALERRNERLQDPDFVEQQAREQLGLVRPGETVYIVSPPTHSAEKRSDEGRARGERAVAPDSEPGFVEGFLEFIGIER